MHRTEYEIVGASFDLGSPSQAAFDVALKSDGRIVVVGRLGKGYGLIRLSP